MKINPFSVALAFLASLAAAAAFIFSSIVAPYAHAETVVPLAPFSIVGGNIVPRGNAPVVLQNLTVNGTCTGCGSGTSGLSTTTPWSGSGLAWRVDNGHVSSVATTTLSGNSQITISNSPVLIGASPSVVSITGDSIGDTQLAFNTGQNLTTASSPSFAGLTVGTLSGVLKGASGVVSAATNGIDFSLITAKTCTSGDFVSSVTAAGVFTCTTPSSSGGGSSAVATSSAETSGRIPFWTSTAGTPALLSGGSANLTWDGTKLSTPYASTTAVSASGTIYAANFVDTSFSGNNCIGESSGVLGQATNCVSSLASAGGTLTISSPTGNVDASLNLAHANTWSTLQQFNGNASTTAFTNSGPTWLTGVTASKILQTDTNGKVIPLTVGTGLSFDGTTLSSSASGVSSITVPQGAFTGGLTFGTTSNTTNGITSSLTITGSGSTLTFGSNQSGTLTVAGGGTGVGTLGASQLLYGAGTGAVQSVATSSVTCTTGASCTAFDRVGAGGSTITTTLGTSVDLTSEVTGALPYANGGNGTTTTAVPGQFIIAGPAGTTQEATTTAVISTATNIGLGTTTPYKKVSVGGDVVIGAPTAGGTNGNLFLNQIATAAGAFLAVNPAGQVIATTSPSSGAATNYQAFTADGTWTKPAGATGSEQVCFFIWGAGGGGSSNGSSGTQSGGGGSSGSALYGCVPASSLGSTVAVTVGTGGTAGVAGGNSTFGTFTAYGGGFSPTLGTTGHMGLGASGAGTYAVGNNGADTTGTNTGGTAGAGPLGGAAGAGSGGSAGGDSTFGGGGGPSASGGTGGGSVYGGGAGGSGNVLTNGNGGTGGKSIYAGGGGGGACNPAGSGTSGQGGTSLFAGAGGAAGCNANGSNGNAPAGGGGAASGSSAAHTGGSGARGEVRVWTL